MVRTSGGEAAFEPPMAPYCGKLRIAEQEGRDGADLVFLGSITDRAPRHDLVSRVRHLIRPGASGSGV